MRRNQLYRDEFDEFDDEEFEPQNMDPPPPPPHIRNHVRVSELNVWRDGIAQAMWAQYQLELARRGFL